MEEEEGGGVYGGGKGATDMLLKDPLYDDRALLTHALAEVKEDRPGWFYGHVTPNPDVWRRMFGDVMTTSSDECLLAASRNTR